jgi:predicted DNA-binding transcriptional regulator AlpA
MRSRRPAYLCRENPVTRLVSIPKLRDLLDDPSKVNDLSVEDVPALRGELATLDSLLLARLLSNGQAVPPAPSDRRLTVREAAAKLGCSADWLYRHGDGLKLTIRMGRSLGFSEQRIEEWMRRRAGR